MIGAISNSYHNIQWPSYANRVKNTAPAQSVSSLPRKAANPEIPVQPAKSAAPVTAKATDDVLAGITLRDGADPTEMAVRARISPAEPQGESAQLVSAQDDGESAVDLQPGLEENIPTVMGAQSQETVVPLPGTKEEESIPSLIGAEEEAAGAIGGEKTPAQELQEKLEAQNAQRQEWLEERIRQQEEAQAQREEYANTQEAKEEARAAQLAALREPAEAENGREGTDTQEQGGYLQLDHTANLLRNHQMASFLSEHLSGQIKGQAAAPIHDAIDTLFQNAYQQRINGYMTQRNNAFAVA